MSEKTFFKSFAVVISLLTIVMLLSSCLADKVMDQAIKNEMEIERREREIEKTDEAIEQAKANSERLEKILEEADKETTIEEAATGYQEEGSLIFKDISGE